MEVARHWRLKKQRYSLVGEVCPTCNAKIFPPRDVCPECGERCAYINVTYYLPEGLQTSKDARREAEKELEAENKNVKFASFDEIIDEQREEEPVIIFTVKNRNGEVVRHIEGPAGAGFHRIAWNLRYPALDAWEDMTKPARPFSLR